MINLYDAINSPYSSSNKSVQISQKNIENKGYIKDNSLSTNNQIVYVNNKDKKILYNVAGSHNIYDFFVADVQLLQGKLKDSNRYKEAEKFLKLTKDKYKGYKIILTGHSLSGAIVNCIANIEDDDQVYTLNAVYTIGQNTLEHKNYHNYSVEGDIVSKIGKGPSFCKTIKNNNLKKGILSAYYNHLPIHIKKENILI
jgi:hypothetical protein